MYTGIYSSALILALAFQAIGCSSRTIVREPAVNEAVVVRTASAPASVVLVAKKPPAPNYEVKPRRPSSRHVWISGHWTYRNSKYVWVPGKWVKPPTTKATWVAGHWKKKNGGWVWVAGYWRR